MFLNKMKEQLGPEKAASFPHSSSSHYPTAVLTVPGSVAMDTGAVGRGPKQEGGGGGGSQMAAVGAHLHPPHTSQNITVVPVPSTGIMTAGQWPPLLLGSPLLLFSLSIFFCPPFGVCLFTFLFLSLIYVLPHHFIIIASFVFVLFSVICLLMGF